MAAGWMALAGGVMGMMSDDGGGAPQYAQDPRVTQATVDEMNQMRELRQSALNRSDETWALMKPYLESGLSRNEAMQQLSQDQANAGWEQYQSHGKPLLDRLVHENVLTPEEEQLQQQRSGSRAMGGVQQQLEQQQAIAARRAAAYGYNPSAGTNINQTVGAAAAKAGAGTMAREGEKESQSRRKAGVYDVLSGRESASKSSLGQTVGAGQAGSQLAGGYQNTSTQGYSTAASISPMNAIQSLNQAGQFGAGQAMQGWQTEANMPSALGSMAQLGMTYMGTRKADGGRVYADGGEVDGRMEVLPGVYSEPIGYADGGEVEDGDFSMVERHDGAMTRGDGSGGRLHGPGNGVSDDIPAKTDSGEDIQVANGEYIIPTDVVEALGEEFFDTLIAKFHTPAAIQRQQAEVA